MSDYVEQMKLSIIYMRLINDIEAKAEVSFTPEHKQQMIQIVSDAVGEAVMVWVARCSVCDRGIELVCDECLQNSP